MSDDKEEDQVQDVQEDDIEEEEGLAFSYGDLVQLKSGGPPMTVEGIPGVKANYSQQPNDYWCTWFKGATRDSDGFPEHVLKSYVAPSK